MEVKHELQKDWRIKQKKYLTLKLRGGGGGGGGGGGPNGPTFKFEC